MGVKKGYKQTDAGVIPEDWDVKALGELGEFKNGINKGKEDFGFGHQFVNLMDVFGIPKITNNSNFGLINSNDVDRKMYDLKKGDVLFVRSSVKPEGVGLTTLIAEELPDTVFSGFLIRFRSKDDIAHEFKEHCFYDFRFRNRLIANSTVSANTNINQDALKSLLLAFPKSKAEQQAIAAALSDVDALLNSLDALIAKKRLIKQGAMQELLTGKKRLPGFGGKWKSKQLGELIAHCSSGATPYRGRTEFYKGSVKWITSGELNYNLIIDTIEHISNEAVEKTNLKIHPVGTFLMAITGLEAAGTRGACGIVGSPATTNQSCMAIYPNDGLKTMFLYHYYVLRGDELAFKHCQGTKQQSYTAKIVKTLPIDVPPSVEEQTAIAEILSDMDAEISALESRREKTRLLKVGMMQELLTGRIRLV